MLSSAFLINVASGQVPATTPGGGDDAPIKVNTLLLTIPVTVIDRTGRNIPGLKKENFSIFQDGDQQDIEFFANEEAPMNVAILLDTSYSTKDVLGKIQKAARDFVKIFRPEDKGIIVRFDYRTQFLSELTSDRKRLSQAIDNAHITDGAGSDMYEAISQIVNNHFASFKGRKAIIVLTDGMVTGRYSTQQILNILQKYDTVFYPIIFKTKSNSGAGRMNYKKPLPIEMLEFLAEESAGRFYEKEAANLKEAFQSIAEELKKQYLLGFYPQNTEPGKSLGHIRIAVDRKDLTIQSKKISYIKRMAADGTK